MTDDAAPALAPHTKKFRGSYLLFRANGGRPPRFRHQSFEAAEIEANRLLGQHPGATFLIMQEVARVKLKPVETEPVPIGEITRRVLHELGVPVGTRSIEGSC